MGKRSQPTAERRSFFRLSVLEGCSVMTGWIGCAHRLEGVVDDEGENQRKHLQSPVSGEEFKKASEESPREKSVGRVCHAAFSPFSRLSNFA